MSVVFTEIVDTRKQKLFLIPQRLVHIKNTGLIKNNSTRKKLTGVLGCLMLVSFNPKTVFFVRFQPKFMTKVQTTIFRKSLLVLRGLKV